jgi:hypothetical protein
MRLTEFPVLEEIKTEYVDLRQKGNDRSAAVQKLMESYRYELEDPDEDDAQLFWIGLADAQYYRKELTEEVAQRALKALDVVASYDWDVSPSVLNRRREHYTKAPMPERRAGKPRPKFRCEWKIGDTFAYQLTSQEAKDLGIFGKYMLLRKVSELECGDGSSSPIVTISLWNKDTLPKSAEEFMSVPFLKLCYGGRNFSPEHNYEYRAAVVIKSRKQLDSIPLIFVGNFLNVPMPLDEIIFTIPGDVLPLILQIIEKELCLHWRINNRIISSRTRGL